MRIEFACRHTLPGGFTLDTAFTTDARATALVGPSGCGKTTVLEMIAGLIRPQHGRIAFGGEVFFDSAAGVWLPPQRRGVGLVFQDRLLFPHLSVEANLKYGWRRRPRGERPDFARVVQVLELAPLLARGVTRLSGGERQRVALGRALLAGPRLLLLDEPLAALDEALKARIMPMLEEVCAAWKIPMLVVTHDPAEVERLTQTTIQLQAGRVVNTPLP